VQNVSNTLFLVKKNKTNSIILNYDSDSENLFKWYQQLVAESLGKKNKGILPVISNMPTDNHSLMQYYLEGVNNGFFTLFFSKEKNYQKIKRKNLSHSHSFLINKNLNDVLFAQFLATEKVFKRKNIPFRSIIINRKNEKTLGELFVFFMLETILLGMAMKLNPFNQPSVELIKDETKKFLNRN
jgi:glucose-6-phosphate isomerase